MRLAMLICGYLHRILPSKQWADHTFHSLVDALMQNRQSFVQRMVDYRMRKAMRNIFAQSLIEWDSVTKRLFV